MKKPPWTASKSFWEKLVIASWWYTEIQQRTKWCIYQFTFFNMEASQHPIVIDWNQMRLPEC